MRASKAIMLVLVVLEAACHCERMEGTDTDSVGSTTDTATGRSSSSSDGSSSGSTGEPFDASLWVGRYHYENVFMEFGELGNPNGCECLLNFEIFPDSRAVLFYDQCSFEEPIIIRYVWEPDDEDGWLRLRPGEGEASLRYMAAENLKSLKVQRTEPPEMCRPQLAFVVDGIVGVFAPFFPGESCWVDRCTVPNRMQVWYCEGEEPPPCP
jgi:hypothetical protein